MNHSEGKNKKNPKINLKYIKFEDKLFQRVRNLRTNSKIISTYKK